MILGPDFLGLPQGNCDERYRDPYPGIIARSYGKDLTHNLWKGAGKFQSRIPSDYLFSYTIQDI